MLPSHAYGLRMGLVDLSSSLFFQAEDGIRDLVRSRGLGDVYKRQGQGIASAAIKRRAAGRIETHSDARGFFRLELDKICLLYTSDAAAERSSVDLGGRRIIKKKNHRPNYSPTDV